MDEAVEFYNKAKHITIAKMRAQVVATKAMLLPVEAEPMVEGDVCTSNNKEVDELVEDKLYNAYFIVVIIFFQNDSIDD